MPTTIRDQITTKCAVILTAAAALAAQFAPAESNTWTGASSGNWGIAANWESTPVFAAGNTFVFHAPGADNLTTFLGSSARTIGGLLFNESADSDVIIRTYSTASVTGGVNRVLTFNNGSDPISLTVAEGAEGDIQVAPGGGRTIIKSNLIIAHFGSGLLTYHSNNWLDDEDQKRFVFKEGPGTLEFGASGWKFGGGMVIRDGRVKILRDDAFGTGTLTMTGGGLSAVGGGQRSFTNSFFLARDIAIGDDTDNGTLIFTPAATGTLLSNTVLTVRGNGVILQGPLGDGALGRSLAKIGPGTLSLAGAGTYGGGTTLGGGRIRVGQNQALGTGALTVTNGTLSSNSGGARALTNSYHFAGAITLGHTVDNGALELSGLGTLAGDTTLEVVSATTLSSAIAQSGGDWSLTKTGSAALSLTLSQVNSFAGGLIVKEGVVIVNNSQDRLGSGPVTLDGGTLRYIGSTVHATMLRDLTVGDAGGAIELNTNDRIITWGNPVGGNGTFTKRGSGPLVFASANTHTGAIVVAQGLLRINGTHAGAGPIAVQSGGAIGGSGSAARSCTVAAGGMLDPGNAAIGTFTLDELTLQPEALYLWEIDDRSSDTVAVNGTLTLPESFAVQVSQIAPAALKNRVLFTYGGTYSGPARAAVTASGDVDPNARYQTLHDPVNKQILFTRAPEGTIIVIQ
jgi:autotransporter-associated beta strand protein